jgi:hypothetical protein
LQGIVLGMSWKCFQDEIMQNAFKETTLPFILNSMTAFEEKLKKLLKTHQSTKF